MPVSEQRESAPEKIPGPNPWWALAVLVTGTFVTILDTFIVNVALSSIQLQLGATPTEIQLILVSYTGAYGLMLLNGARLGDRYGRKRLFLSGMGVFTAASVCCGAAPTPSWLIIARVVQGLGAALLSPQIYASIRLLFEGDARRHAFAVTGVATGLAGVVSQLVGGLLIDHGFGHLGWRLIFLVNLPVGLTALCGGRYLLVETRAAKAANLDLIGAAIAALTLGLVLLPIMLGREFSWPWWSVTAPLLAVPMLICFVRYEKTISRQGGAPLVDISLFRNRRFVFGVLAVSLFYSAIASFFLALTMYLQPGLGFSPLTSGMIFAPTAACFVAGSLLAPRLSSRIGNAVLVLGVASFAIGIALSIFVSSNSEPNLTLLVISLMLNGLGQGLVIPVAADVILSGVPVHQAGISSGILVTFQVIGNIVGVVVVGIIFYSMLDFYSVSIVIARASGYGHAFASATLYNLAAALISGGCFASLLRTADKPQASLQT